MSESIAKKKRAPVTWNIRLKAQINRAKRNDYTLLTTSARILQSSSEKLKRSSWQALTKQDHSPREQQGSCSQKIMNTPFPSIVSSSDVLAVERSDQDAHSTKQHEHKVPGHKTWAFGL